MMIAAGLWKDRDARRPRPYQPCYRRDCRGELIQVDCSKHWWMEDRGPQCTLLVYIDDATSELMQLKMALSESTFAEPVGIRRSGVTQCAPPGLETSCPNFRNTSRPAKSDLKFRLPCRTGGSSPHCDSSIGQRIRKKPVKTVEESGITVSLLRLDSQPAPLRRVI